RCSEHCRVASALAAPRQDPLRGAATGFFPSTPQLRRRLLRWLRSQTPPALLALPTRATSDDPLRHLLARSCRADRLRAPWLRPPERPTGEAGPLLRRGSP